jgi:hypothetical protein
MIELRDNNADAFPDPGKLKSEQSASTSGIRPGDLFNLTVPVEDVLAKHGWQLDSESGERKFFTRPGKDGGVSASVKDGTVWVFTSSVPSLPANAETGKPYTAFALVAHLEYGGDFKRAAKELAAAGFCSVQRANEPRVALGSSKPPVATSFTPLPEWRPFPVQHLPAVISEFVRSVATAMRCDPTFAALPALAACAGMIGATRVIRLKRSWVEPAILWVAVVGERGVLKSPPYRRAVAPVIALQAAHFKAHTAAME